MKMTKNDKPRILLIHCLNNFPIKIMGTRLKKIKIKRRISVNSNAHIVYTIERTNFALGSKLCRNDFFFINLNAFKNSKDIFFAYLLNS